jgi:hypothetical protein
MYHVRKIWNTALFQGVRRKRRYFEGWYFKHVSPEGRVYAVIPGIALSAGGSKKHAFIQTIDGNSLDTHYVCYSYEDFSFSKDSFGVTIGGSTFSAEGITVDVRDGEFRCYAECEYDGARGLPFSLINPNAMGWYSFVPFMECYHGLVSLDHGLRGYFEVDGRRIDFDGGRGYIEKDWGRSFPSSWVWMQTNSFKNSGDSFMLSIARIPWLGNYFVGFLGFAAVSGMVHKFATYTGARLDGLKITESEVQAEIRSGAFRLTVTGLKKRKGLLQAPVNGVMERRIQESIDAEITLEIKDSDGEVIFSDTGKCGGLEIVGDPQELAAVLGSKKRQSSKQ